VAVSDLDEDPVAVETDLVDRYVLGERAIDEPARAHVVAGEVERAFEEMAVERATGQGHLLVAALVGKGVEAAFDIDEEEPLALDRNPFHLAGAKLAGFERGDELVRHRLAPAPAS
jgi:hypothetical protein